MELVPLTKSRQISAHEDKREFCTQQTVAGSCCTHSQAPRLSAQPFHSKARTRSSVPIKMAVFTFSY